MDEEPISAEVAAERERCALIVEALSPTDDVDAAIILRAAARAIREGAEAE